ncbi:uncharacterized protein LOC124112447 [Haliotis rufescens]|uniref:uncharacterized protein LOC124112447 n=1 Tax=Haliotis rufescens TaxID=6454 RepID=UPI00201EE869|nr:uncharacterized protein LOC124112447 [Haliotis rufescens]
MKALQVEGLSGGDPPLIETGGDAPWRQSGVMKTINAIYKVTRREIQICSEMARKEKNLWTRKDARSLSERMQVSLGGANMTVTCRSWDAIPSSYIYPRDNQPRSDQSGCGDEAWVRNPKGTTFSAVREDGSRSTVVFVPLSSNKMCTSNLFRGPLGQVNVVSADELKEIIFNHLQTKDTCLQIFTQVGGQKSNPTTSCGSQASKSTTSCGSQTSTSTTSCGAQVSVATTSSGIQVCPRTRHVEIQASPAQVDVACQTDPVPARDVQVGASLDSVNIETETQDTSSLSKDSADSTQFLLTPDFFVKSPSAAPKRVFEPSVTKKYELIPPSFYEQRAIKSFDVFFDRQSSMAFQKYKSAAARLLVDSSECTTVSSTERSPANQCIERSSQGQHIPEGDPCSTPKTVSMRDDVHEYDVFATGERTWFKAKTKELSKSSEDRNELSLADELAQQSRQLPQEMSCCDTKQVPKQKDIDQVLLQETRFESSHRNNVTEDMVTKTTSHSDMSLVEDFPVEYTDPHFIENLIRRSFSGEASPSRNMMSLADELQTTDMGLQTQHGHTRNTMSLAMELAQAKEISPRKPNPSVEESRHTSSDLSLQEQQELMRKQMMSFEKAKLLSHKAVVAQLLSARSEKQISDTLSAVRAVSEVKVAEESPSKVTDDVMLRVFGFDPRVSPFTVNGYPLLPSMSDDLDHIDLPILEKRDVRFAKKDDGMFKCVGRGAYGCVYLAEMSGREGKLVVKDYINEGVIWEVIQHEARLLKYLSDTNCVPEFVGLITSSASIGGYSLVQEYFGNGLTILKLLFSQDKLSKKTWMSICCQLAEGLEAIHAKHVLLNDLKSDNVLVDLTSGLPKIRYIDVGMATYRQGLQFECSRPQVEDHNYLAPEVCMGSHSSILSDIYSLGHLLGQIGRKSQIPELESVSQSCTEQLPIERMSLATVWAELDVIFRAVAE